MTYYISQGRVVIPIRRGRNLCCSSVANLLQYLFAKNYENTMRFEKVIAKIKGCHLFVPQCTFLSIHRLDVTFMMSVRISYRTVFDACVAVVFDIIRISENVYLKTL